MLPDPRQYPGFSNFNRLVHPLPGEWDWNHTFRAGEQVVLDLSECPVEFDQASDIDLEDCAKDCGLELPTAGDDGDTEAEGELYVLKETIRALHGRKGVVLGVSVDNGGGYQDYITVELWGGGELHAWSAIHFRPREGR